MVRNQSRRSISISGTAYTALKAHCDKEGCSQSGVVEELLRGFLDLPDREALAAKMASAPRPKPKPYESAKDIEVVLKEVTMPPIVIESVVPAPRVDAIRAAKERQEVDVGKKKGIVLEDMASKIFTF